MMRKYLIAPMLAMVAMADDDHEDEIEVGKLVAWIITGTVCLIVVSMLLTYCICSRALEADKRESK